MCWHFSALAVGSAQRPTVEGFLVGVIELQPADPSPALIHALDNDLDEDVLRAGLAARAAALADMQIAPEQIGHRDWHGDEIAPVDGHTRPFLRDRAAAAFFQPALGSHV